MSLYYLEAQSTNQIYKYKKEYIILRLPDDWLLSLFEMLLLGVLPTSCLSVSVFIYLDAKYCKPKIRNSTFYI